MPNTFNPRLLRVYFKFWQFWLYSYVLILCKIMNFHCCLKEYCVQIRLTVFEWKIIIKKWCNNLLLSALVSALDKTNPCTNVTKHTQTHTHTHTHIKYVCMIFSVIINSFLSETVFETRRTNINFENKTKLLDYSLVYFLASLILFNKFCKTPVLASPRLCFPQSKC